MSGDGESWIASRRTRMAQGDRRTIERIAELLAAQYKCWSLPLPKISCNARIAKRHGSFKRKRPGWNKKEIRRDIECLKMRN